METVTETAPKTVKKVTKSKKAPVVSTFVEEVKADPDVVEKSEEQFGVPVEENHETNDGSIHEDSGEMSLENILNPVDVSEKLKLFSAGTDTLTEFLKDFKDLVLEEKEDRKKFESIFKKLIKTYSSLVQVHTENSFKQLAVVEKTGGKKKPKVKKEGANENKSVNKKMDAEEILLNFMKKEPGTQVSRAEVLQSINGFVREEKKDNKNPDIFVIKGDGKTDNTVFNLVGDLKTLFDGIQKIIDDRGEDNKIPSFIGYKDIMKYTKYVLKKSE